MNNARRKSIDAQIERINALRSAIEALASDVASIRDDVESIASEEQDAFDSMPEALQSSEKGEKAQSAIDALGEAQSTLDTIASALTDADLDDIISQLDTAKE